jgi:curli biogenesis system outer membrane secretion channel CsgG
MKKIRLVIFLIYLLSGAFSLLSCASTPEVDREEILSRGDTREVRARIFVSPTAKQRVYEKVAVMPFRAPVELVGSSMSDMFATEILRTYKYQLVERSQMEQVLGEQALGLKGVTENILAIQVGKILGVQGVIVGTVPEYGSKASGKAELSAIGINIRMIDVSDGGVVWSITDTAISDQPISLSAFANRMVRNMVDQLTQELVRAGDTVAVNIPAPRISSSYGTIRGVVIDILPDSSKEVTGYNIFRSRKEKGTYYDWVFIRKTDSKTIRFNSRSPSEKANYERVASIGKTASNTIRFEDKNLLDAENYFYRIRAKVRSGFEGRHRELKITTAGPPEAVTGLRAQSGILRKVSLAWQPSTDPNAKGYNIFRKTEESPWVKIQTLENPQQTSFTDERLEDNKAYSYRIIVFNVVGSESPPSQVVTATTKGAPSAPKKN